MCIERVLFCCLVTVYLLAAYQLLYIFGSFQCNNCNFPVSLADCQRNVVLKTFASEPGEPVYKVDLTCGVFTNICVIILYIFISCICNMMIICFYIKKLC